MFFFFLIRESLLFLSQQWKQEQSARGLKQNNEDRNVVGDLRERERESIRVLKALSAYGALYYCVREPVCLSICLMYCFSAAVRLLSGDDLFSTPKVSWSFSNSDLRHCWTLTASQFQKHFRDFPTPSPFQQSPTLPCTPSTPAPHPIPPPKAALRPPPPLKVTWRPLPTTHPPIWTPLQHSPDTLRVVLEMEQLLWHPILEYISLWYILCMVISYYLMIV